MPIIDESYAFEEIIDDLLRKSKFLEELCQTNVILRCAEFAWKKDYGFLWSIKNEIGPITTYLILKKKNLNDIKKWTIYAKIFLIKYIRMTKTIKLIDDIIKNLSLEEHCTFIKVRPYPRNHSDVDLLIRIPNKLVNALKTLGFKSVSENGTVIKMGKKGFLPIEIHSRLSWEGLEPINSANIISNATRRVIPQFPEVGDILLPSYLDDFLITIAHKFFQEGTITIGDLIHLYYDIVNNTNCKKFKQEDFIRDLPWGFLVKYCTLVTEKLFLYKSNSVNFSPTVFPIEVCQFFHFPYFKIIKKYGKNSVKWSLKNIIWTLSRKMHVLQPSSY